MVKKAQHGGSTPTAHSWGNDEHGVGFPSGRGRPREDGLGTLRVPATDVFYEERGRGLPVLWLQGLGADHSAWSPQLARFASWYRCLAPDNRGSGKTAPGRQLSLQLMAQDAASLLSTRAAGTPAHVVGLSMGASIAMELGLQAPELVRSLVLVSGSTHIEPRLQELLRAWRSIYPLVPAGEFQRLANTWLFTWRFFEKEGAAEVAMRYAERTAAPSEWFVDQVDAAIVHDQRARLGELRVPSLVITGAEDQMVPPSMGRALAAAIPGGEYVEIPEAGHSVNQEQQRVFNEALRAFLDAH
jgi:3-oxoadipate enol-lactonase